jgi:quercetin dioxygenase-like cupin family protein
MRFLITGAESGGAIFMSEVSVAPGGGPPPHIHHTEDESFYLLEGSVTLHVGERTVDFSVGDFGHVPRGTVHWFKNIGKGDVKMLVTVTPAGLEKFFEEAFYRAVDGEAAPTCLTEAMLARVMIAAPKYGLELLPPA